MIRALIIGRAAGVWDEVERARALAHFDLTIVVGRAAVDYPGEIDHWVSWHADLFQVWMPLRAKAGAAPAKRLWSGVHPGGRLPAGRRALPYPVVYLKSEGGSSGFLAVQVAMEPINAANKIVLAGIPMDPSRSHYDQPGDWRDAIPYRKVWEQYADQLRGRVKSMSGWTAKLLGEPTQDWLNEGS